MKVFVSYKWEDAPHNAWVERLARDLRLRGIEALVDNWEVRYGESFSEYMTRGIHSCDAIIFVMTPAFLSAAEAPFGQEGPLKFELQLALARRLAGERFRIIGVLRRGERAAQQLRDLRYADFRDDSIYEDALNRLVADLVDQVEKPLLKVQDAQDWRFHEHGHVGDELEAGSLAGEFLSGTHDLVVWMEADEGPKPVGLYRTQYDSYSFQPLEAFSYATRIRAARGHFLVIQELEGIRVFENGSQRAVSSLPIVSVGDPVIRSEALHPTLPWVAIGTDYGRVVVWDWLEDRIMFHRHNFPAGEINWISALSFSRTEGGADSLLLCVDNSIIRLRADNGELLSQSPVGPPEETTALDANDLRGSFAVGGVMDSKVYKQGRKPTLLYQIRNSGPLVKGLRFSPDGRLLGIVDGGLGGSSVSVVEAASGASIHRFVEVWPPGGSGRWPSYIIKRSVSFSSDGRLVAIGEGGRVGLYRTPEMSAPNRLSSTEGALSSSSSRDGG